ncbi:MAG: methyltransferase domain-containing protein [Patescibacteria group bacterium]|jgi:tRNA (cmo5U34)-methyltransferase|nr:methyltransferase domain-containing protein [Patescibacteria group bacterium]
MSFEKVKTEKEKKQEFYSDITQQYEIEVNRFVPGYVDEIVPLVTAEVAKKAHDGAVLDIGSGVGNVDEIIINQSLPQSIDLVEVSKSMIEESKRRLKDKNSTLRFHNMSAVNFDAAPNSFDSVLSNLVIHNIPHEDKSRLISNIYRWLKEGGIFVWTDLMSFSDPAELEKCFEERKKIALAMGATEKFAEDNFKKEREEDHMITVEQMMALLKQAGFQNIEILWTKYNEVVMRSIK